MVKLSEIRINFIKILQVDGTADKEVEQFETEPNLDTKTD
jgi:hypothetical protein